MQRMFWSISSLEPDCLRDELKDYIFVGNGFGGAFFGELADDAVGDFPSVAGVDESFDDIGLVTRADERAEAFEGGLELHSF